MTQKSVKNLSKYFFFRVCSCVLKLSFARRRGTYPQPLKESKISHILQNSWITFFGHRVQDLKLVDFQVLQAIQIDTLAIPPSQFIH